MKSWSLIGLLFAAAIFATIPISPQVTPRGLELNVDHAQAVTYGHYRRVHRRGDKRFCWYARRAYPRGYYYGGPGSYRRRGWDYWRGPPSSSAALYARKLSRPPRV